MVKDLGFPLEHNNYIEYHHQMWFVDESTQKQEHSSIISEHRLKSARLQKGPELSVLVDVCSCGFSDH